MSCAHLKKLTKWGCILRGKCLQSGPCCWLSPNYGTLKAQFKKKIPKQFLYEPKCLSGSWPLFVVVVIHVFHRWPFIWLFRTEEKPNLCFVLHSCLKMATCIGRSHTVLTFVQADQDIKRKLKPKRRLFEKQCPHHASDLSSLMYAAQLPKSAKSSKWDSAAWVTFFIVPDLCSKKNCKQRGIHMILSCHK